MMINGVISIIVIFAIIFGIMAWSRRMIYKEIDRYEAWKIDIMNRPVTEEIARVKQLKMIGETEKKFENWRQDWDDIITVELPSIEDKLFDAEESADKYRFKKAKQTLQDIKIILESCEERIKLMLSDLNKVVDSEEQNRKDITFIRNTYHNVKKQLITNRSQYHNGIDVLETILSQIENGLKVYDEQTNTGNYIRARDLLLEVKDQMDHMSNIMENLPHLYKELQVTIPNQLKNIQDGYQEMTSQGYVLGHLQIKQQIRDIQKHLQLFTQALDKTDIDQVQEGIHDIKRRIDTIYEDFEKEVESRKQVNQGNPVLKHDLFLVGQQIHDIQNETESIQQSYRVDQEDLDQQKDLSHAYEKLQKEYDEVDEVIKEQKQAYSILLEKMEDMRLHLNAVRDAAESFNEKLQSLRSDELQSKETIQSLKKTLLASRRLVEKSNLPGLPDSYITIFDEAQEVLSEVSAKLDEKPLEMHKVNQLLQEALNRVTFCEDKTKEMVESALLCEKLIQYGNRYRSESRHIAEELNRAEVYFRSYNYEEALEIVALAINQVDSDALKKFDVSLKEIS